MRRFWYADRRLKGGFGHADGNAGSQTLASLKVGVVGSKSVVSRKTLQIVVLLSLVALVLAYPVIECRDYWDAPGPTSDSELQFIGVLTLAGAFVLLTQVLTILSVSTSPYALPGLFFQTFWKKHILVFSPHLTASPPLSLRI